MSLRATWLPLLLALALPAAAQDAPPPAAPAPLALRGRVHLGDGTPPIPDGVVVLQGGRIVGVGPFDATTLPADAQVISPPGAELTPGLIDASSTVGVTTPESWAEHGAEVVPHLSVLDAVDLRDPGFARLAARGVTAVCLTAGPESVIGGRVAVVKTAGRARVVVREGAVKANLGPEAWRRGQRNRGPWGPITFATRRPTTRMGAVWVFRDALARAADFPAPAGEVLAEVVAGEVPLRVQARTRGDIETALRLTREAGVELVLEEGTEVRYLLDLVAARRVPVIFGPLFDLPLGARADYGEAEDPALYTPRLLAERDVPFCLTAADLDGEADLWGQALMAVRYGLTPAQALAAVTSAPAALLGAETGERLGLLAEGRDADVVVWSGRPLEATSRPLAVLVNGEVVAGALPAAGTTARPGLAPGPGKQF